jgi:hypothetical protein
MEHALSPASTSVRGQSENRPIAISATKESRAVQIPCDVKRQSCKRSKSVLAIEGMENSLLPASVSIRGQLKDRTAIIHTACRRGAIEVSHFIEDQRRTRIISILPVIVE